MANSAFTPAVLTVSGSSSTSSGEKNYVTATDGNTSGLWVASGVTVATSTSTIPDNITKASSLAITWTSGTTGYARYRFTLDQADYGKRFKIQWDQVYGTAGHWTLQVWSNTASDYTGTSTQLTVQTSAVPGITGTFTTSVDMPGSTAPYIEIRIVASSTSATTIYLNSILVGPGTITQGAAISEWQSYNNALSGGGSATFTYVVRQYRRVGSSLEIYYYFGVSANGSGGSLVQVPLPTGLNIDLSKVANETVVGEYTLFTGTVYSYTSGIRVYSAAPNTLLLLKNAANASYVGSDLVNGQSFYAKASVPIAEWAGSGTVNLGAGAQVEYAYNSSTTTTDDTSSFAYGPAGIAIQNFAPSGTGVVTKRVRFQYPIQQDDQLVVEVQDGSITGSSRWVDVSAGLASYTQKDDGTIAYGITIRKVAGSDTDLNVQFCSRPFPSNPWSDFANWKWRVRKAKASSPVGFGLVNANDSGLMKATSTLGLMRYHTSNGYGSTNTTIRRFSTLVSNTSSVTYADTAAAGTSFTITESGVYAITYSDQFNAAANFGISLNSNQLTTSIASITASAKLVSAATAATNLAASVTWTGYLVSGDIIRPHSDTTPSGTSTVQATFTIQRLA